MIQSIKNIFKQEPLKDDLIPRGIRSTYGERGEYNETFEHIYTTARKL